MIPSLKYLLFSLLLITILLSINVHLNRMRYVYDTYTTNNSFQKENNISSDMLIAHAGGEINGFIYTDSLEALNHSYKEGFRLFELDILKTKDNQFVAVHDWRTWKKHTNYHGSLPPTLQEFKAHKIENRFTPLAMNDINHWFQTHTDATLVTDKVNEPKKFVDDFIDKNRLIMELFTVDALKEALALNIKSAMPTWRVVVKMFRIESFLHLETQKVKQLKEMGIKHIAMSHIVIEQSLPFLKHLKDENIKVYAFHVNNTKKNDEKYILQTKGDFVYGIYADKWCF